MASADDDAKPASAPPWPVLLFYFIVCGSISSFAFGREPGTLPQHPAHELALPALACALFVTTYELFDVMAVGMSKQKYKLFSMPRSKWPSMVPEEVQILEAIQRNQVEQAPFSLIVTLLYSTFVSGYAGGVIAMIWVLLRRRYVHVYRNSVAKSFNDTGIVKITVPAYFCIHTMSMGTIIHMLRILFA
eukprot:6189521-Pleurochrysis_carterae.AAC.1